MKKMLILIIAVFCVVVGKAQLPSTYIVLFDMQYNGKNVQLAQPRIIRANKGYNNQPYFSPDGEHLYFTSSKDTNNTELYKYDIRKKKTTRLTKTKSESEYSPTLTVDMNSISCVRVEKDKVTQTFTSYTLKGKKPVNIMPGLTNIGYYQWINPTEFLSFELPEPFTLTRRNLLKKTVDTIASHVGRCFQYVRSKSKCIYVDKSDSIQWTIRQLDLKDIKKKVVPEELAECLKGEEDFAVLQDGSLLMGQHGKMYIRKNPFKWKDSRWEMIADLGKFGISRFYRIATTYQYLAVVVYEGEKP